jgi:hypothetical protein
MKKIILIIAMIAVSVMAKAECETSSPQDFPVRESIATIK